MIYELHIADTPLGFYRDNVTCQSVKRFHFKHQDLFILEMNIRRLIPDVSKDELSQHANHLKEGLTHLFASGWLEAYYWFTPNKEI